MHVHTHVCVFEHISSCSIAHMSMTHHSTNMCRRYIYMTTVNAHRSNLRKNVVFKNFWGFVSEYVRTITNICVFIKSCVHDSVDMSTKLWTLPKHKLHLQNCSHAYTSKYSHWLLPMVFYLA